MTLPNHHNPPRRDLTFLPMSKDSLLVIACDSCGGVGEKPQDVVQAPPEITGYFTSRVAVMEVLAVGASLRLLIDTLSVAWEPDGRRIMAGIHQLLQEAGLEEELALNGSTEENMPMVQTAMGITVIGEVKKDKLVSAVSQEGDCVVIVGLPKMGKAIQLPVDPQVISITDFITLRKTQGVNDIIPVGSKGIAHESELMAAINDLALQWEPSLAVNVHHSAGPATCVVAAMTAGAYAQLSAQLNCPMTQVGTLVSQRR